MNQSRKRSVYHSDTASMAFKIILVGEQGVGKTSLVLRYIKNIFSKDYQVTIGFEFYSKVIMHKNQQITIQIWDTAGQQAFKSMIRAFYRNTACVFLLFSLIKPQSLEDLQKWVDEVRKQASPSVILVLVGTKNDLVGQQPQISREKIQLFKTTHSLDFYIEISAKNSTNIQQLFNNAIQIMLSKYETNEEYKDLVRPVKDSFLLPGQHNESIIDSKLKKKRCERC